MIKPTYVQALMFVFGYDITEESQRKLPKHDFCVPDLYKTPSSFRFIRGHLQCIDGSEKLINDFDQTFVMIRPKAYVGSSGSIWASDYLYLRWSLPQIFEESSIVRQRYSICFRSFASRLHGILLYFLDVTNKADLRCMTDNGSCIFRKYEELKLAWLGKQIYLAITNFTEEKTR